MATTIPNIIKETYRSGQILQVEDFLIEQEYHIQHRQFQTRQLLSPGILIGLEVTNMANILEVTPGAAIDENGQQLLLTASKTLEVKEADGDYLLLMTEVLIAVIDKPYQLKSDPLLNLVPVTEAISSSVLLANITITQGLVSIAKAGPQAEIRTSLLPGQPQAELDASAIRTGVFPAERIPELQKLQGKLTTDQLPADLCDSKDFISFFAKKTVVTGGDTVLLSWKMDPGVDSLMLEYYSESGIVCLQSADGTLPMNQSDFSVKPTQNTTYTLTAGKSGTIVAQKQLYITVFTLKTLVEGLFQNHQTANDCVGQIKIQFPASTPYESALSLAKAGYSFSDTGAAIKNGYTAINASEFGKIMAYAFPSI